MKLQNCIFSIAISSALVACMSPISQSELDPRYSSLTQRLAWIESCAISASLLPPVGEQTFMARYWIVSQAPDEAITGIILYKSGKQLHSTILKVDKKGKPMGAEATIKTGNENLPNVVRATENHLGRFQNRGSEIPSLDGTLHILSITEDRKNLVYQCPDAVTRDDEYARSMASLLTRLMREIEPTRLRPLKY